MTTYTLKYTLGRKTGHFTIDAETDQDALELGVIKARQETGKKVPVEIIKREEWVAS